MVHVSDSDLSTYRDSGYLILRQALDSEALESTRALLTRAVDRQANKLKDEGKISNLHEDEPFHIRLARLNESGKISSGMFDLTQALDDPDLFTLVRHPVILDAVGSLLGPEVAWTSSYVTRPNLPSNRTQGFPWHQDSQYYGDPTNHLHIVSLWTPLVDVDEPNGCLYLMPGSQKWGLRDGKRDDTGVFRNFEDIEKRGTPFKVPMSPGDLLLFSNLTFHCSKLNRTDTVRWAVDMRFVAPPDSRSLTAEEREGYATLDKHYRTPPITVRSEQPENEAGLAQLKEFIARRNDRRAKKKVGASA